MQEVQTGETERTCATCKNWKPKESGAMARFHFAVCALGRRWRFLAPASTCPKHTPAEPQVIAARRKWLA